MEKVLNNSRQPSKIKFGGCFKNNLRGLPYGKGGTIGCQTWTKNMARVEQSYGCSQLVINKMTKIPGYKDPYIIKIVIL